MVFRKRKLRTKSTYFRHDIKNTCFYFCMALLFFALTPLFLECAITLKPFFCTVFLFVCCRLHLFFMSFNQRLTQLFGFQMMKEAQSNQWLQKNRQKTTCTCVWVYYWVMEPGEQNVFQIVHMNPARL